MVRRARPNILPIRDEHRTRLNATEDVTMEFLNRFLDAISSDFSTDDRFIGGR